MVAIRSRALPLTNLQKMQIASSKQFRDRFQADAAENAARLAEPLTSTAVGPTRRIAASAAGATPGAPVGEGTAHAKIRSYISSMPTQIDLFGPTPITGPPRPPGIACAADIITPAEETALIAQLGDVPVAPFRFQGWLGKRLTASFGWRYDFEDASFAPAKPIPDFLLPLRDRAARFAGLAAEDLVQALIVRYDPGAGIGWHRDRPVFEHVVGISLEAPATLRLRHRRPGGFDRAALPLPPRSIYHLSGEARHLWEHSIAAMDARRWSVTFRSLSDKGERADVEST
jgi:alkylated DNA repair protein (DNA oxidative demethylase)